MSIQIAVCITALSLSPADELTEDQVDLVEINHFYDDQGRLVFDQVIYYDWHTAQGRYQVRDWRLLKTRLKFRCETGAREATLRNGKISSSVMECGESSRSSFARRGHSTIPS